MQSLLVETPGRNPGKVRCSSCGGVGRSKLGPCWSCDSQGYVIQRENVEPEDRFLAMQGDATLDVGKNLEDFVDDLTLSFSELRDEEIVVWRERKGGGLRVVAILYPDKHGETATKWM